MTVKIGDDAPGFCLKDADDRELCLENFRGKWVILYFYPKDGSKSCTAEAADFTKRIYELEKMGVVVIGVSPDSVKSHKKFMLKYSLKVILLSDPESEFIKAYGAWGKKILYGKEYMGVIRSTFIINPEGKISASWQNVKVSGHVDEVINKFKEILEK